MVLHQKKDSRFWELSGNYSHKIDREKNKSRRAIVPGEI